MPTNARTATGEMYVAFGEALACRSAGDLSGYFGWIRQIHKLNEPAVKDYLYDPMIVEWPLIFTPIEYEMWINVRERDLPMFPQYPVGRYFVDFGDPWSKTAVECDGKAYHQNRGREVARDEALRELGWSVWHLSGSAIWREKKEGRDPRLTDGRDEVLEMLVYRCRGVWRPRPDEYAE